MSIWVLADLTTRRERAVPPAQRSIVARASRVAQPAPGVDAEPAPPTTRTYVDAMAALVPAEVLAFHALAVGLSTKTEDPTRRSSATPATPGAAVGSTTAPRDSGPVTTITNRPDLQQAFWILLVVSYALYLFAQWKSRGRLMKLDFARAFLPAAAFVAWTMLQPATAFDVIAPGMGTMMRTIYGLVIALSVTIGAAILAHLADSAQDPEQAERLASARLQAGIRPDLAER